MVARRGNRITEPDPKPGRCAPRNSRITGDRVCSRDPTLATARVSPSPMIKPVPASIRARVGNKLGTVLATSAPCGHNAKTPMWLEMIATSPGVCSSHSAILSCVTISRSYQQDGCRPSKRTALGTSLISASRRRHRLYGRHFLPSARAVHCASFKWCLCSFQSALAVASVATRKKSQVFWSTKSPNPGNPSHNICSSISIADTGVGAMGDWTPSAVPWKPKASPWATLFWPFRPIRKCAQQ